LGPPDVLAPQPGGCAIWLKPGNKNADYQHFKRICIVDEDHFNRYPHPHVGFLYTTIFLPIPLSILNKVLSISSDIIYDVGKKELILRGMSLGYNTTMLLIICRYVKGEISWYHLLGYDLIRQITRVSRLSSTKIQQHNRQLLARCCKN
jgi:hypothetical protein